MLLDLVTDHLITWMILVPGVSALALLTTEAFGGLPRLAWRVVGLASATANLALGVLLYATFDPTRTGFQRVDYVPWIPDYGIHYYVGVDGISLPLVLLTVFLVPIVLVACSRQIEHAPRAFVFVALLLESYLLGAFTSLNLFQFYLYAEGLLVPTYLMIGVWGAAGRIQASLKLFVLTALGSVLLLLAMLTVAQLGYLQTGVLTFDLVTPPWGPARGLVELELPMEGPWWQTQHGLFAAFALAFAIKVPLVPFHAWLPDAQVEAPTAGSVLVAALLLEIGAYGFLRFALPLFPEAALLWTPGILTLCVVGIVYGSLLACAQTDLKRIVAYTAIVQLGFAVLGIFAQNLQGLNGSVLQLASHGLAIGGLFLLVGMLDARRGTRELAALGGIARAMPSYAFFLVLVALSGVGVPFLAGFVGEFLILLGAFRASPWHASFATLGFLLAALYTIRMLSRVLFGPAEDTENRKLIDLDWREKGVLIAICLPLVGIGLYPSPLLRRIEPSVSDLLQQIEIRQQRVLLREEPAVPEAAPAAEQGP